MSLHHALRTAAGSPSDPYWSNTSLLLLGNGTNGGQNNTFIDSSSNAFTITRYGNVTQGSFSPFTIASGSEYSTGTNGGSGWFDGTGDYLSVPSSSELEPGSGDFTIELWFYPTRTPSVAEFLVQRANSSGYANFSISYRSNNKIEAYFSLSNTGTLPSIISSTNTLALNSWHHVAFVKSGLTHKLYLNGVENGSVTPASHPPTGLSTTTLISDNTYPFLGWISTIRITKTAVYTAAFTPSTTPLTAITNTSLLLNFTNASIIDSTGKNDLETVGDAQISTSTKKFGTGSIYLDGNGDYLSIPYSSAFDFGTGDFTIEAWVYLTASPVAGSCILGSLTTNGTDFQWRTSTTIALGSNANAWRFTSNTTTFSLNTWFHIAVSRSSGTAYMWLNGSSIGSGAETTSFNAQSGAILIGRSSDGYFAGGYIDDLRITKGVARYTAAFTPPSRQLPAR